MNIYYSLFILQKYINDIINMVIHMDFINGLENNSILVIPNNLRDKILNYINKNKILKDIKIQTFNDIKINLLYDYNNKTIYYLMNKYNLSYSQAKKYLNDIYYLDKNDYSEDKLKYLLEIKKYLEQNNLLIKNNLFTDLLKSKNKLYVYGYSYINKFNNYLLNLCSNYIDIKIINTNEYNYSHQVYEFKNMNDEITYIAESIMDLYKKGIDLNKIYIANYSDEYYFTIKRIFKSYGIPYYIKNETSLYETSIGSYFLDNLDNTKEKILNKIKLKYNIDTNKDNEIIYNQILDLINSYYWIDDLSSCKNLITEEMKHTTISSIHYTHEVHTTNIIDNMFDDDEYVFLIGFNLSYIPKFKKDEDYLSDDLHLDNKDNTNEYNRKQKEIYTKSIKNIKNLIITYKLSSPFNIYSPSILINENNYEVINEINKPSKYNDDLNKLEFAREIDYLIKFNENNNNLSILNNSYDINYKSYDNKFTNIDNNKLIDLINNKIKFSYSNIKNYYQCPFSFYLNYILKIGTYEQNFGGFVGSLFHYILENCLNNTSLDIDDTYDNYIKDNQDKCELHNKEYFFLDILKPNMHFVIDTIREQYAHMNSNHIDDTEKEIILPIERKINTILKGYVDKIIYIDNKAIIVDYKTNGESFNMDLLKYGLSLQLPIYLYLLNDKEKNIEILGLYIQHILDLNINYDPKSDYIDNKKKNMKLDGITFTSNDISLFDDTYEKSVNILGLGKKKDGQYLNNKHIIDIKTRDDIKNTAKSLIDKAIDSVSDGNFEIHPLKIDKEQVDACKFCQYKDICYRKYKDFNIQEIEESDKDE